MSGTGFEFISSVEGVSLVRGITDIQPTQETTAQTQQQPNRAPLHDPGELAGVLAIGGLTLTVFALAIANHISKR
ncbi:MAG TPA: hypothetical protein VLE74_00495 [Candidatus Saccharimonadales bacterium]|nr:hypothetical protein [Candidatus Saccharimonadales bacterium]